MYETSLRRTWAAVRATEELAAAVGAVALFAAAVAVGAWVDDAWAVPVYAACYLVGGWAPGRDGIAALREGKLDVDLLMVVAAAAAAAIGQWFDGGLLIVIFATSGAIEHVVLQRTEQSVRALMELAPEEATLLDRRGGERVVPAADLVPGQWVIVRPGERVPADGRIVDGRTDVDHSSLTGESAPVARQPGDDVFAGTINGTGAVVVEVARGAGESVIARIAALVAQATSQKSKVDLYIERFEQRYSVGVVLATLVWLAVPTPLLGWPFRETLIRAMSFMIVASPCAVVLATMPPLLAAIAVAGRRGVLVRTAAVMEQLGAVDAVLFDKTGTLTLGELELTHVVAFGADERWLLRLASGAETGSEHSVGQAIVAGARARGVEAPPARDFRARPGRGVEAVVDGHRVRIGNRALLGGHVDEVGPTVADVESDGATTVVVEVDGRVAGVLGVTDRVRPDSEAAVAELRQAGAGRIGVLTGDRPAAVAAVASRLGVDDVRAELLPEEKMTSVRALQEAGHVVAFVGDGVNDAPALAAADVGVAMGRRGTDVALETADVVLVADELRRLPRLLELSRRANGMVRANLAFAMTAIVVLVGLDVVGRLPLPLAVAGHEGSTVVVGLNSLRLLRAWPRRSGPEASPAPERAPALVGNAGG